MARMLIALCLLLVACDDGAERQECVNAAGQVVRCETAPATARPVSLRFDDAPSCPAPSSPRADSYVDHGGASHALSWYLLMRSLDGPSHYRETHVVHHYAPRPVYVTRPAPNGRGWVASTPSSSYARPIPSTYVAPRVAPVVVKPASGWTQRTTTSGTRAAPSPSTSAPKSSGYGYKPTSSGGAFKPSSSPSFRSSPSTSSFRSSGSSFGGGSRSSSRGN